MSGHSRKPRSTWDNKEENQISTRTSEQNALQERESYSRHLGHDPKSSDTEADYALKSRDFPKRPNWEPSPRSGQKDAKKDSFNISRSRRPGDVAKSYPVSPRNHEHGQQDHIRSPEGTWDPRSRSKGRSRSMSPSRGRSRSRSITPSRGRSRSRSISPSRCRSRSISPSRRRSRSMSPNRGRKREVGYGRSRSPLNDYNRREPHRLSERRSGFGAPPSQVCRNFIAGNCRRERQCGYLHPDNPYPRNGGRSERDQPEKWGTGREHGGSRYDVGREESAWNNNSNVCNDFLKGRCQRGSSCRYSHREAAGDNTNERQPHITPCRFFMMGRCTRDNCRFSHDAPIHDNRKVELHNDSRDRDYEKKNNTGNGHTWEEAEKSGSSLDVKNGGWNDVIHDDPHNDKRDRDYVEKNKTWIGPTWDEAEKRSHSLGVRHGGWDGPAWDNKALGSDIGRTVGWGDSAIENVDATVPAITERDNDDEREQRLDEQRKNCSPLNSKDVDIYIAGSEVPKEINKVEPQYETLYKFSMNSEASVLQQPTSAVSHSVLPENSHLYNKLEGNITMACGFDPVNGGDIYAKAKQIASMHGHNFNRNSDASGLPLQQIIGINQDQIVNSINPSDGHTIDLSGRVQENKSPFKAQNSIDTQLDPPVINHRMPQMIDQKPVQISNFTSSLTDQFVNEQLPQLYAMLNPAKPSEFMPFVPDSASLFPPISSINAQPDPASIYQKRNSGGIESNKPASSYQYLGLSSNSIAQNGGSMNNNHISSQLSQQTTVQKSVPGEPSKPIAEKSNQEPENNGAGNIEADATVGNGANGKDEKAMRLFKNSLVEFVKDILKPKWKEGHMSRDVHKAIVKKVVDKVTSATQGANIPSTQAKLDQYLEGSKSKLTILVEAYIERYAKTS